MFLVCTAWKACYVYVVAGRSRLVYFGVSFCRGGLFLVWTECHVYVVSGFGRLVYFGVRFGRGGLLFFAVPFFMVTASDCVSEFQLMGQIYNLATTMPSV